LGIKAEFLQVSNFEGIWIHMLKINWWLVNISRFY
jgi:hypothetical protein